MTRLRSTMAVAALAFTTLLIANSSQAIDPDVKCESGKLQESSKYAACRLKADANAVKKGAPPDYTKCDDKFTGKWATLEEKAGPGICPSEGDLGDVQSKIVETTSDIALGLSGCPGAAVGGACWILGASAADCDATCVGAGLSYDTATATYAGSSGTDTHCMLVLDALGAPTDPFERDGNTCGFFDDIGCAADSIGIGVPVRARCTLAATTSGAFGDSGIRRACACQ